MEVSRLRFPVVFEDVGIAVVGRFGSLVAVIAPVIVRRVTRDGGAFVP